MRTLLASSLCLAVLAACGGKISDGDGGILGQPPADVCDRVLPCPKDTQPADESRDACRAQLQGVCGPETRALQTCLFDHLQCNAEGRSDLTLGLSYCQAELDAYTRCQGTQPPPPPG